jgi:hypothetical protein
VQQQPSPQWSSSSSEQVFVAAAGWQRCHQTGFEEEDGLGATLFALGACWVGCIRAPAICHFNSLSTTQLGM